MSGTTALTTTALTPAQRDHVRILMTKQCNRCGGLTPQTVMNIVKCRSLYMKCKAWGIRSAANVAWAWVAETVEADGILGVFRRASGPKRNIQPFWDDLRAATIVVDMLEANGF